jgi:hypothetical protein
VTRLSLRFRREPSLSDIIFKRARIRKFLKSKLRTGTIAAFHAVPVEICLGATLQIVTRPATLDPITTRLKIGMIGLLLAITTLASVIGVQLHEVRGGLALLGLESGDLLTDLLQLLQLLCELRWFFFFIEVPVRAVIFVVVVVSKHICPRVSQPLALLG